MVLKNDSTFLFLTTIKEKIWIDLINTIAILASAGTEGGRNWGRRMDKRKAESLGQ